MEVDFPNIKLQNRFHACYDPTTNTVYVGYRMDGRDEKLIEALLNHELMHWILLAFVGEEASVKLDNCLYGLHPETFEIYDKVKFMSEVI